MCCHFLAAAKGVVVVVGMEFPRKSRVAVVSVCILIASMIMPTCPVIIGVQKKKKKKGVKESADIFMTFSVNTIKSS